MTEVQSVLAGMWKECSESDRKGFLTASAKGKEKYDKEMDVYKMTENYVQFQRKKRTHNLIAKYVNEIPGAKKKNLYQNFPADPNAPKRAPTAYMLFCADH